MPLSRRSAFAGKNHDAGVKSAGPFIVPDDVNGFTLFASRDNWPDTAHCWIRIFLTVNGGPESLWGYAEAQGGTVAWTNIHTGAPVTSTETSISIPLPNVSNRAVRVEFQLDSSLRSTIDIEGF